MTSKAPKTKSLLELEAGECRWPVGDPRQDGFHFCGEPAEPGRPYCTQHCHVAYHKKSEAA